MSHPRIIRVALTLAAPALFAAGPARFLDPESFAHYVEFFNRMMPEEVRNEIPDAQAWAWMKQNIPVFTCPDAQVEELYYYRWWAYRKHIKRTPKGYIVTEFLKPVKHATDFNAISCAFGHHVNEGRWLRDRRYLDDYIAFWLRGGENGGLHRQFHQFSGWASDTVYARFLADGNQAGATSFLDALVLDYEAWESERLRPDGLFWQRDVSDGMEESASGGRRVRNVRPSINSYMYGNAAALAAIAALARKPDVRDRFDAKARRLRELVEATLWNPAAQFFETRDEAGRFVPVREAIGFTPWYFNLPGAGRGYEEAWKQLTDPQGFAAPFGPTSVERRSPLFRIAGSGDDCQWNGPNWPFATTIALKALANVVNAGRQTVRAEDWFLTFLLYTATQHWKRDDGSVIPFIDENLNPLTGVWQARAMKIAKGTFYGRGDHYNHSGYADLLITGLAGLRPRADGLVEVNPLLPAGTWDWFCLDNLPYHGRSLTILWDRTGGKFGRGKGLQVFRDAERIASSPRLERVTAEW